MLKKTTLNKLFNKRDCWGWAYECKGKRHKYIWQNDNDLGLCQDIDEAIYPETILHKVKIQKGAYVYILRNNWGLTEHNEGEAITLPQLKAALKDCHKGCLDAEPMTKHDEMLSRRVFGY